jgi:ribosomal protein L11 methyltransferase
MSSSDLLHIVSVTVAPQIAAALDAAFELRGISPARWEKSDSNEVVFEIYLESTAEAEKLASELKAQLEEAGDRVREIAVKSIPDKNWQDAWKDFFHVEQISPRIIIKPSHEDYTPEPGDCVLEMDPGMSFGTGQHATTRGCLKFLDKLTAASSPASFLDLGCGSGILSIAAAKLGIPKITAIDIDADAVEIARENAAANGVADSIEFEVGDVSRMKLSSEYDIVAANILARVLLPNAAAITTTLCCGGYLMLAGILTEQYDDVQKIYTEYGLRELETVTENEWTSALFVKNI